MQALFAPLTRRRGAPEKPIHSWDWHDIEQFEHSQPEWEIRAEMERRLAMYGQRYAASSRSNGKVQ